MEIWDKETKIPATTFEIYDLIVGAVEDMEEMVDTLQTIAFEHGANKDFRQKLISLHYKLFETRAELSQMIQQ